MATNYPGWQADIRSAQAARDARLAARSRKDVPEFKLILSHVYGIMGNPTTTVFSSDGVTLSLVWVYVTALAPGVIVYNYAIDVSVNGVAETARIERVVFHDGALEDARAELADAIDRLAALTGAV